MGSRSRSSIGIALLSLFSLVALTTSATAQVSSDDRRCIEAINGETRKLVLSVHKQIGTCVGDFAKGALGTPTVVQCVGPAASVKVAAAMEKALDKAADRCTRTPPFGPPNLVGHAQHALSETTALLGDLFGTPVEHGLSTQSAIRACQKIVLKAAAKCQTTRLREFNTCKKMGMVGGGIHDATTLRNACLGTGTSQPDPVGIIAKSCIDKPRALIAAQCQNKGVSIAQAFPGCGATNTAGMTTCLDQRITCRTCEMLNAVDGLTRDCDLLDDGNDANQSCNEPTTCGDGIVDGAEACDDGDASSGDGCSASCQLETGWTCSAGAPTVCQSICGDGLVRGTETCDDHGTAPGDGCGATCQSEAGWTCSGQPSACAATCGDGLVRGSETCDDHGTAAGDGCSATCRGETGWTCGGQPSACASICGDGLRRGSETCDDHGTAPGDGCDATCHTETGFTCTGQPSVCTAVCGDGLILGAESCDDGCGSPGGAFPGGCGSTGGAFPAPGDGCDTSCEIEVGWGCSGQPSVCAPICGDGLVEGDETCDDGDLTSGDGCNAACRIEAGFNCAGEPSGCVSICSDGLIVGSETCDDGDLDNGDGCNGICGIETGWACTGAPSACAPVCGDRRIIGSETCDDGNHAGMDGCSALCAIEPGYVCSGLPSVCSAFHVVITSPENGQFIDADTVTVTGVIVSLLPAQASLRVNGVTIPVAPNGTFSRPVPLDHDEIFNPIRATVTHTGTGSTAHDRVMVIAGDSVTDGDFSYESVALRLNDTGLDQVEPLVADLAGSGLDLADLVPVGTMIVDNECFIDSIFGCLGRGTVRVANPPPSFASFGLAIDSMTNFVAGDITVHNIRVNTYLSGSGLVPSCDINIQANAAFFNGDYSLEPKASDPTSLDVNQIGAQQVSFSGFNVSYGGICDVPIIGDIIQAFMPDVQALAIGGIAGFLADPDGAGPLDSPTADAIETALEGIQITGPIGEGLGTNLDAPLFEVTEDNVGITLGSDSRFVTEYGPNPGQCVPPTGAPNLTASYATNTTFPLFGARTPEGNLPFDLSISISSEGFNQLLKSQTECGLLVTSITELNGAPLNAALLSALLPQFAVYPPATPFRIDVRPTVGPIVSGEPGPNGELAELKVGQIIVSVVQADGPQAVALRAAVDADIGLDLSFAPGGLGIGLTPPDPSDIRVAILYNPLGVNETNFENNVLPPLVALLLPDLAGSLAGFPLPDFLGLQLNGVEVSRNGDFMSLFANLRPAP